MRAVSKFVETPHWKEALKILKLAVTRSSTLVAPPSSGQTPSMQVSSREGRSVQMAGHVSERE